MRRNMYAHMKLSKVKYAYDDDDDNDDGVVGFRCVWLVEVVIPIE